MDERSKTYVAPLQDDSDWHALVRFLSAMKWKRRYSSVAMDGLQWELTYEIDGKKKSHYGSNEFPTDFDDFTALLRLIADKQGVPEGIL
jgi:hypothetical protein